MKLIIVYKDGTWEEVDPVSGWEFENDPDWLVSIPILIEIGDLNANNL